MSKLKIAKIIICILSILLGIFVLFESYFARLLDVFITIFANEVSTTSYIGIIFSLLTLLAGITGLLTLDSKEGSLITGTIYISAALIGFILHGFFLDLIVYGVILLIFGIFYIVDNLLQPQE